MNFGHMMIVFVCSFFERRYRSIVAMLSVISVHYKK